MRKMFPVMVGHYSQCKAYVPWGLVLPHEKQAIKNHDQTLEQLAGRGGLSPCELAAVLEDRAWTRTEDEHAWRVIFAVQDAQTISIMPK